MERPGGAAGVDRCHACRSRLLGVFRGLGEQDLAGIDRGRVVHHYRKGQVLHYEGNPAQGVDCLRSGRAKVYRSAPRDRQHILRIAEAGDLLGLPSVLAGEVHASTAEMIEDGSVCHIDRDTIVGALGSSADALRAVTDLLASQLLHCEAERAELASGTVRERMASTLLDLTHRYGVASEGGLRIDVKLSREELAEMIGASPETAIRQLSEFRAEGIVSTRGRSILVADLTRLARAARTAAESPVSGGRVRSPGLPAPELRRSS